MNTIREAIEEGILSLDDELEYSDYCIDDLLEEIERLNKEIVHYQSGKYFVEMLNEKNRLNNIINELEKDLENHIALCTDITINDVLDKIKELKENK